MSSDELTRWAEQAYALGADHARNAASWVTDGNESDDSRARKLAMLEAGDPAADDFLPRRPNLSGEFADDPTPASLCEGICDAPFGTLTADDVEAIETALCDAYENGVSETFEDACAAELRKWIGEDA